MILLSPLPFFLSSFYLSSCPNDPSKGAKRKKREMEQKERKEEVISSCFLLFLSSSTPPPRQICQTRAQLIFFTIIPQSKTGNVYLSPFLSLKLFVCHLTLFHSSYSPFFIFPSLLHIPLYSSLPFSSSPSLIFIIFSSLPLLHLSFIPSPVTFSYIPHYPLLILLLLPLLLSSFLSSLSFLSFPFITFSVYPSLPSLLPPLLSFPLPSLSSFLSPLSLSLLPFLSFCHILFFPSVPLFLFILSSFSLFLSLLFSPSISLHHIFPLSLINVPLFPSSHLLSLSSSLYLSLLSSPFIMFSFYPSLCSSSS